MIEFPISGVETYWWLPVAVAFGISCITSTAGVSGAFLLLPFQVSVLGFSSPAVTPTNLLYNIVAIPSGLYRFYREKRMVWPLIGVIAAGTLPGELLGVFIRVRYLPDPGAFKLFVGLVLLYIAGRLVMDVLRPKPAPKSNNNTTKKFEVRLNSRSIRSIEYEFNGVPYKVSAWPIFLLSLIVGAIGGIYGIGGGAIMAPFLVTVFGLPVYTIAGAALFGTFLTSIFGVLFYTVFAPAFAAEAVATQPDWILGLMFGVGGSLGIYVGARIQRFIPARLIKTLLALIMISTAVKYILGFFL
jgi:uncharacterized membrane protein YfcA